MKAYFTTGNGSWHELRELQPGELSAVTWFDPAEAEEALETILGEPLPPGSTAPIPVCKREYRYGASDHRFFIEPRVRDCAPYILNRENHPLTPTANYQGKHWK